MSINGWMRRVLLLGVTSAGLGLALIVVVKAFLDRPSFAGQSEVTNKVTNVEAGLLVLEVLPNGKASVAGLRPRDIIVRYADMKVLDQKSYSEAVQTVQNKADEPKTVRVAIHRDGNSLEISVPPGKIGFTSEEWNPQKKRIYEAISCGNLNAVPTLISEAEQKQLMTRVQLIAAKLIFMQSEGAAGQERQDLLSEFLDTYPSDSLSDIGYHEFFKLKDYRSAAGCFERHLSADPADVSIRLNLANCYVHLNRFADSKREVHSILGKPRAAVSPYGYNVAWQILGRAALGTGEYQDAEKFFGRAFDYKPFDYVMVMYLYACARKGDIAQFRALRKKCDEADPEDYRHMSHHIDAIESCLLKTRGRTSEATNLILKWKKKCDYCKNMPLFWSDIPGGKEIIDNWKYVMERS